jgi:tetratricopeptide (TPR) repeat protein
MSLTALATPPPFKHVTDLTVKARLVNLRESVAPILANNLLPHFTDHSVAHSDSLARYVDELIQPLQVTEARLNEDELFVLYAACYLHDIGMQHGKAYETKVIADLKLLTPWDGLTPEQQSDLIRRHHAAISAEMVRDSLNAAAPIIGLQLTVDYFPTYVAALCEGHTLPVESERYKSLIKAGPNLRIELLSGLLRIADILDLSRRRANRAKALTLNLGLESQTHWWRHHYTEDITIDQNQKLVSVWFDFPKSHYAEYRKVVPQIQMPWIQEEFARQTPVFHRYGLGWSLTSVINDRPDSAAEPMPDSVMAEMLKQLHRQLKWAEDEHRQMVVKLFEESQPHIDRRLAELESRNSLISRGDYLREVSKIAADLSELGGRRSARRLLRSAYHAGQAELNPGERLEITTQLVTLLREEDDTRGAVGALRELVPLAEALPDSDPRKLLFWKTWATSLAEEFAYTDAIAAFDRAIKLSPNDEEKNALRAELAEVHLLSGNVDEALKISSEDLLK